MLFRKKIDTRVFEPEQFHRLQPIPAKGVCVALTCSSNSGLPHVHTLHRGQAVVLEDGDWIMPEPDGIHFYPIKPDIFAATYEPVSGEVAPLVCCVCGKPDKRDNLIYGTQDNIYWHNSKNKCPEMTDTEEG